MKTPKNTLKRKERDDEPYEVSRWTPLVKDLVHVKEYLASFPGPQEPRNEGRRIATPFILIPSSFLTVCSC